MIYIPPVVQSEEAQAQAQAQAFVLVIPEPKIPKKIYIYCPFLCFHYP